MESVSEKIFLVHGPRGSNIRSNFGGAMLTFLMACAGPVLDVCECPASTPGHAVEIEGRCSCLASLPATPLPESATRIALSDGEMPDWAAIDTALVDGDVIVTFAPGDTWDRMYVLRTNDGPHRLVLDGGSGAERARVKGILTPYDEGPRHRITVRGFEVTKSRDKGIYWEAGDGILIEDVVIHDNGGSPALNLQYSNRSGHVSDGFTVRNIHMYDQNGECLYIGGAEGTGEPSHTNVVVENNLIHDCQDPLDSKDDAINIKDVANAVVTRNVVARADWGIEIAAPGAYHHNLVLDTRREGFMISDFFAPLHDMDIHDNAVIRPGHDGFYISSSQARATDIAFTRNLVVEAGQAGLKANSNAGMDLTVEDFVVVGSEAAFDGYGDAPDDTALTVSACRTADNGTDFDRIFEGVGSCDTANVPAIDAPAGADGVFFTDDDPWLVEGGARLAP